MVIQPGFPWLCCFWSVWQREQHSADHSSRPADQIARMEAPPKKTCVPLEEALSITGDGMFTTYVMLVTGLVQFSGVCGLQVMSIIIPAAGCDLGLSGFAKGLFTSMAFTGLIFSSFLFGFLADRYGRRRVMLCCSSSNVVLTILTSFAPNDITIMIVWFINGFLLGGVFTPALVFAAEFCPQKIRARSILLPTCVGSMASIYLPGMAWLILPLDISIPVYGNLVFSSWRLFLALVAVPTTVSTLLLYNLPDTPKYTLNQGNEEETLRILRSLYAVNRRNSKIDFPIASVCLDVSDRIGQHKATEKSNCMFTFISMLNQQFVKLFTPPLLLYSCISCCMLCGVIGLYNTLYLWFPEQMRILMQHYNTFPDYKATLCDVLSQTNGTASTGSQSNCALNEDIFIIGIITAVLQTSVLIVISFIADKIGKKFFILLFSGLGLGGFISLIYANKYFITVAVSSLTVIILATLFPVGFSIIVDFFPTSLRSTATSVTMVFGRIGASGGSQLYGMLFQTHCQELYWGMAAILAITIVLIVLTPTKRKP